jgi:hypothetical protein
MKKALNILSLTVIVLSVVNCGGKIIIQQNEHGLYGLKRGSKWVVEPVYINLLPEHFICGDFYIAKKIPGTQKHYHVIYNSKGKLVKECNAGYFFYKEEKRSFLYCTTPDGPNFGFLLDSLKEKTVDGATVEYWGKDFFHYSLSSQCRDEHLLDYWGGGIADKKHLLFSPSAATETASAGYTKTIPQSVIMDEAVTLDKGGACYAFKLNGSAEASFKPGCVIFTDQGLVVGVSAEKFQHFQHKLGEQTEYFFYPNSEVNKDALYKLGLTARIGLLYENDQWNVVSIEPMKTGSGNYVHIVCIAGQVTTDIIDSRVYSKRMAPDLWKPKTILFGALLQGTYADSYSWPFYLWSAANQK